MSRSLATDAVWVVAGQAATAVATVIGIRLLTEFVSPATFGVVALSLGGAALVTNLACSPLTQAALHFYPAMAAQDSLVQLRESLFRCIRKPAMWVLVVFAIGTIVSVGSGSRFAFMVPLVALLVACDCMRAFETTFLNAARQHKRFSLWVASEAWLRPILATAATLLFGESAPLVLGAYLAASFILLLLFGRRRPPGSALRPPANAATADEIKLDERIWKYALPMIPLGLIDWTNGVADRYIIGSLLTVADAGVYAAAYGLASRPFSILGQSIELAIRPVYQTAVSAAQHEKADRLIWLWFGGVTAAGALGVALVTFWRAELAQLMLGASYQQGAELMPWIAAGYALLAMAQVFQRICFAHGDSKSVLWIQTSAAIAGLVATIIGARGWGLWGAAIAVPVCFAVQLATSVLCAHRSRCRSKLLYAQKLPA